MNKFLKYALVGVLAAFTLVAAGCGGGDTKAVIPRGEPDSCIAVIYSDIAHMKPLLFFIL